MSNVVTYIPRGNLGWHSTNVTLYSGTHGYVHCGYLRSTWQPMRSSALLVPHYWGIYTCIGCPGPRVVVIFFSPWAPRGGKSSSHLDKQTVVPPIIGGTLRWALPAHLPPPEGTPRPMSVLERTVSSLLFGTRTRLSPAVRRYPGICRGLRASSAPSSDMLGVLMRWACLAHLASTEATPATFTIFEGIVSFQLAGSSLLTRAAQASSLSGHRARRAGGMDGCPASTPVACVNETMTHVPRLRHRAMTSGQALYGRRVQAQRGVRVINDDHLRHPTGVRQRKSDARQRRMRT